MAMTGQHEYDASVILNGVKTLIELAKIAKKQGVIKGILLHQGETNNGDANWPNRVKTVYNDTPYPR